MTALLRILRLSLLIRGLPLAVVIVVGVGIGCSSGSSGGGSAPAAQPAPNPPANPNPPSNPNAPVDLTLRSIFPADQATDVAVQEEVEVIFSTGLDLNTLTGMSFFLEGSVSGSVPGARSYDAGSNKLVFTPILPYSFGETITVNLTTALKSDSGGDFEGFTFTFVVIDAPPPPPITSVVVDQITPAPFAQDVEPDAVVTVDFSAPLNSATLSDDTVQLMSELTGTIEVDLRLENSNQRLVITPHRLFHAGETVTVNLGTEITGDSGSLSDDDFEGALFTFRVRYLPFHLAQTEVAVTSAAGTITQLFVGDFNIDGALDIAYLVESGTAVHFLLGDGSGALTPAPPVDHESTIFSAAFADVDLDGDLDIIVGSIDRVRSFRNERVQKGVTSGIDFVRGSEVVTATPVNRITVANLDHRGRLDYLLDTDTGLEVLLESLTVLPVQKVGDTAQARSNLGVGDIDVDGRLDVIFGQFGSSRLSLLTGTTSILGDFVLENGGFLQMGSEIEQVAIDSIQNRETPEMLLLTSAGASLQGEALRLVVATETGFEIQELEPVGNSEPGVADTGGADLLDAGKFTLADLENDSQPDVLLSSVVAGKVFWLASRPGEPLPATGPALMTVPQARDVTTADLDGDGRPEVIAAGMNEIHVLKQQTTPPPMDTFSLTVTGSEARQETTDAPALVRITNSQPLDSYRVLISYDASALTPTAANFDSTVTESATPEFVRAEDLSEDGVWVVEVVVDAVEPLESRTLPVSQNQPLFRTLFDVRIDAPLGDTDLRIIASLPSDPQQTTTFGIGVDTVIPNTVNGTMTVLARDDPPANPNQMWIDDTILTAGMAGVIPVRGSADQEVDGYTTAISIPTDLLTVESIDLEGSATGELSPDFSSLAIDQSGEFFIFSVLFDMFPPIDSPGIAPSSEFLLYSANVNVVPSAEPGVYGLSFRDDGVRLDGIGPQLFNVYAFGGMSVLPALIPSTLEILPSSGIAFIRGDVNGDGRLNVTDAVFLTSYLFDSGTAPPCLDAADVNDDGSLSVTDVIFLLRFLGGSPPPPPPFAVAGTDPTPDSFTCLPSL